MSRRDREKQRRHGERERLDVERPLRITKARKRLPDLFRLFDGLVSTAARLMFAGSHTDTFEDFQWLLYNRAFNCLKSIKMLTETGHWEGGSGLARQMFELSVNIEFMFSSPDPERSALRFYSFGALQQMLYMQQLEKHYVEQGYNARLGEDVSDESLTAQFPEFRAVSRKGHPYWLKSWTGKSLKDLVDRSTVPERAVQYRLLFSPWSEQIHATPGSFAPSFIRQANEDTWVSEMVQFDDRKTYELIANSINIFFEIVLMLPVSRPQPNDTWVSDTHAALKDIGTRFAP